MSRSSSGADTIVFPIIWSAILRACTAVFLQTLGTRVVLAARLWRDPRPCLRTVEYIPLSMKGAPNGTTTEKLGRL